MDGLVSQCWAYGNCVPNEIMIIILLHLMSIAAYMDKMCWLIREEKKHSHTHDKCKKCICKNVIFQLTQPFQLAI